MKRIMQKFLPVVDYLLILFVYPSAWLLKLIRRTGVHRLPKCRNSLMKVGVFPIGDHYFEPQFDHRNPRQPFSRERNLSGINWNESGQLENLVGFNFADELANISQKKSDSYDFYFNNGGFESGDAEYWYQLIRAKKPCRIFEIGSGNSTLMALKATRKNRQENSDYLCKHVCIEPFEIPWLEDTGVSVLRKKVEDVDLSFFAELAENDILFIDSSHIIRPQGDVLFEYLQLLPTLNRGVIVHLHDIFSPRNYLRQWLQDEVKFWNEQYLLEAFLTHNGNWEIFGALNYLHHNHYDQLKRVAPYLNPGREPGSFYIQKIV